jgi:hypothetical protein
MHWCQDETLAAASAIPVVGVLFRKVHKWYHKASHHKCHNAGCEAHHLDHVHEEPLLPNPTDRAVISVAEVDHLFGQVATIMLMCDRRLLKTREFPPLSEFVWFMKQEDDGVMLDLSARWKNKFFVWDGTDWKPEFEEEKEEDFSFGDIIDIVRSFAANEELNHGMLNWQPTETFVKAQKLLKQIDNENPRSSSQGLDPKQEADSGSTQSNQETT